jgi:nicotinamide-nucleotide amidase
VAGKQEYPQEVPGNPPSSRPILTAELLSVGSELTTGETRDTNAGELAAALTGLGVSVVRLQALPDELDTVRDAFGAALERADLVVSTGGLGPTPDDLTREAIAGACDETPAVDQGLEEWLRGLWARRGMPFPEINLKQAWLIPTATAIPNGNGTAPGWWVDRPDGRVIVALPGPPREMRPMWMDWVLPGLHTRGLGRETSVRTLRLSGIGESAVADTLGEELLRAVNPVVATYARADAVDVRIAATAEPARDGKPGRSAAEIADAMEAVVLGHLGQHVWARGAATWAGAIGERMAALGWRAAMAEVGTGGELAALLAAAGWLERSESLSSTDAMDLEALAEGARTAARTDVGLAVRATPHGEDMAVTVAITTPRRTHTERRLAFLGGASGRSRAALTAASVLFDELGRALDAGPPNAPKPSDTSEARTEVHR